MKTRRAGNQNRIGLGAALLGAALLIPVGMQAADPSEAGRVTAVEGTATAQQPAAQPRALRCGDPIYAGDRLVTEKGARLGMLVGDVLTHLSESSQLALNITNDATPDARLEQGGVRLIDPRDSGALGYLAALDARAEILGNDVEAYVFAEKVGSYAMLCEWDTPLRVTRGAQQELAAPGNCVIAKKTEPLYVARAHDQRIPALAEQLCAIDPGALAALAGDPARHLSPAAVAAAGPLAGGGSAGLGDRGPASLDVLAPSPCDTPGSGCATGIPLSAAGPPPAPF
ncbi:MAG: hypothetical protein OEM49_05150 [Myxococcales bacterium]|nr:hypothetical protein [Myxococcales bacterium]MDH5307489.1 hypothetical protein [Myxococcales bacterium]MDH5567512.1 hypothetical protein [Myxococcales bacterium]